MLTLQKMWTDVSQEDRVLTEKYNCMLNEKGKGRGMGVWARQEQVLITSLVAREKAKTKTQLELAMV